MSTVKTEILKTVHPPRVGTRNHPGPCPRISTTWSFQSVKEAKREEMMKHVERDSGGLWSAGRDGAQFDGVGFVGENGDGSESGSRSAGAGRGYGPRSGIAGSRGGMGNKYWKGEEKKWLWQGVTPNDRVAMDVAFGDKVSADTGHGVDGNMGTDYYSQVERDLKALNDIDAEIEADWTRENWKAPETGKGKRTEKMASSVGNIEQPSLDWRMDDVVKMEDEEILDWATRAGNYWKRRKY